MDSDSSSLRSLVPASHPPGWDKFVLPSDETSNWTIQKCEDDKSDSPISSDQNVRQIEMQPLSTPSSGVPEEFKFEPSGKSGPSEQSQIEFSNGLCQISFSCLTGNLSSVRISNGRDGRYISLIEPVKFNFYRAPTDNDKGGGDKQAPIMEGLKQVGLLGAIAGGLTVGLSRVSLEEVHTKSIQIIKQEFPSI